jgi:hypothetical protein
MLREIGKTAGRILPEISTMIAKIGMMIVGVAALSRQPWWVRHSR